MGKIMICPKCKQQVPEKTLRCNHCAAKIATFCKNCHAYNSIYNLRCISCKAELLKVCPACQTVNFPNADVCRKCGQDFSLQVVEGKGKREKKKEERGMEVEKDGGIERGIEVLRDGGMDNLNNYTSTNQDIQPSEESHTSIHPNIHASEDVSRFTSHVSPEGHTQQKAKELLIGGLLSQDKKILSLSGAKGSGKSIVLKSAMHELKDSEIVWLLGECSAITQISPCGLIQDILLTFFNVMNFCSDSLKLKKDSQKFFQSEFPSLTNEEIFNLLNFIYPTNTDYFENILLNKEKTFTFLNKVFKTVIESHRTVIAIENFDFVDGFSYEFLHNFINSDLMNKKTKILLTYDEIRPVRGYLYSDKLYNEAYFDISLGNFDKNQMNTFIDQYFSDEKCPDAVKEQLFAASSGNPAVLEQLVSLVMDYKSVNNSFEVGLPTTFNEIINMRLDFLKKNPPVYKILIVAAIQGIKFYPSIINQILKMQEHVFEEEIHLLVQKNFIVQVSEHAFAFKNSMLWSGVFDVIKHDERYEELSSNLFAIYSDYTLSSNSIMAVIAQNINQNLTALNYWTENTKIASYIGDTNLYAISQKQCLVLIDKLENVNGSLIKNNIYERLGKLLAKSNPKEAIEYLPNAITNVKKIDNVYKEIELTGYLASCCISLGDYYGTIECVDATIAKLDYDLDLEIAMLKSRKLDALLNIGNSGEIVNLVDNEIMPVFDKYITNAKPHKNIPLPFLYEAWLQTWLSLANALIMQGNNRSFEILTTMFEIFKRNNFEEPLFICKTKLALAFANTMKGYVDASEEILGELIKVYKTDIMDNEAISRWNLINVLNNFMQKKYSGLKEELFQVVTFANNINDNFTKNILKTMLGKLFKDEENAKRALEIYGEQVTYFSKEKNAIGALLTWYFIAEAKLISEGPEKSLEVSQKALEVAQSSKICNYFFIILFNKVIAEAFMAQAEYGFAKVHLEKAIMMARKFELLNLLSDLYLMYGKYLQDMALGNTDAQEDYVIGASKMYKKALLLAQGVKNSYLLAQIEKAKAVLNSFCQLNGITLKDG